MDSRRVEWRTAGGESFTVDARIGKPLDVVALKQTSLDDVREYARELASTAAALYAGATRVLDACPLCAAPAGDTLVAAEVYGVAYRRCVRCSHVFVREQPAEDALAERFAASEALASTYTDVRSLEVRLEQVVRPKVQWTLETFRAHRGRPPREAVDVGAGGGHFVAALREAGIAATGYEVSEASRRFARDVLSVELVAEDFTAAGAVAELVCFWGLLEYTPSPRAFLEAARAAVGAEGMLVVEVPRFDCFGTAVQRTFAGTVARHLDPTSHVNLFADEGLATALAETGFRPVAAWYFGMDAYELAVQLALRLGDERFPELAAALLPLQPALDEALYCDDVVVAALPQG